MMDTREGVVATDSLAGRIHWRIAEAYGGNQRAFAEATGLTPQHVYAILSGKIALPRPDVRRTLAREIGVTHPELLVLAGQLAPEELTHQTSPLLPEERELNDIFRQLTPNGRDALLNLSRELLRHTKGAADHGR
jgi:transcriptional regulator with XRE-family HTH domain